MNIIRHIIYPGTFDPFHIGHKEVIQRVIAEFPNYKDFLVLIEDNVFKNNIMFNILFRTEYTRKALEEMPVRVDFTDVAYLSDYLDIVKNRILNNIRYGIYKDPVEIDVVLGDDCLDSMTSWKGYSTGNLNNGSYRFIIVQRHKSFDEINNKAREIKLKNYLILSHTYNSIQSNTSSTKVRADIMNVLYNNIGRSMLFVDIDNIKEVR